MGETFFSSDVSKGSNLRLIPNSALSRFQGIFTKTELFFLKGK
jgi:hypothetical protein